MKSFNRKNFSSPRLHRYAKHCGQVISNLSPQRGFTLIELLIVIAILGVLAAGILVAINPVKKINQAKDSALKTNMGQIVNALQASYTANNGMYPAVGTPPLQALVTTNELKTLPKQPNDTEYNYVVSNPCTETACSAVVWGSYSDTPPVAFHCWDSTSNAYKKSLTAPTATTCP